MPTQCNAQQLEFSCVGRRRVVAAFDGGAVSSDAGALLLGKADAAIGLIDRLAQCFVDERDANLVEHSVRTLIGQRVFGMALGYEDLNDHDCLRHDAVFGALLGKLEPQRRGDCAALAGKSTLNRLELHATQGVSRYHKIRPDGAGIERLWVDLFLDAHRTRRARSFWIWTPPMTRCTGIRRVVSFMAITTATVICRCISSRASICCARSCAARTSMGPLGHVRKLSALWRRSARAGRV